MAAFRPERTVPSCMARLILPAPASTSRLRNVDDYMLSAAMTSTFDLRGYGHSTRPTEMSEDPANPTVRGDTAVKDIGTAIDFIPRDAYPPPSLIGWSGPRHVATLMTQHPNKVGCHFSTPDGSSDHRRRPTPCRLSQGHA